LTMLINEELHSAFAGLRAAVEKTEEAVRAIQQAEQAKLREALRSQAEASKKAELAAVEIKEATLEADAAREAQSVSEARSDKLSEKLQDKREEVRKLDELLEKYEDKLLVKRKEAKAMEEYMDKLEALLQKEKRGGTSGKKTGSKSASARAASPCQVENYDQESTMSRSRTRSPAALMECSMIQLARALIVSPRRMLAHAMHIRIGGIVQTMRDAQHPA